MLGCDQGRVIAALRSRGLWDENAQRRFTSPAAPGLLIDQPGRYDAKRTEAALAIWQAATPAGGTLVEAYFVSRGLRLPPPSNLRFHAGLKHRSGGASAGTGMTNSPSFLTGSTAQHFSVP
jgi:putative DNA primase/helicase